MYDYSNRPLAAARWIAPDRESASPVIRREFLIGSGEDTSRAKLYITGLGFFEAYLNGRKLGDEYFQPLQTDYEPRAFDVITYPCRDRFTHKIFYLCYDVSPYLKSGRKSARNPAWRRLVCAECANSRGADVIWRPS